MIATERTDRKKKEKSESSNITKILCVHGGCWCEFLLNCGEHLRWAKRKKNIRHKLKYVSVFGIHNIYYHQILCYIFRRNWNKYGFCLWWISNWLYSYNQPKPNSISKETRKIRKIILQFCAFAQSQAVKRFYLQKFLSFAIKLLIMENSIAKIYRWQWLSWI